MSHNEDEYGKLLDHDYDGIKELDNDLPRWWLYLFYITIVWGTLYLLYYHVFDVGYLSADEYKEEMNPNYVRVSEADTKFLGILDSYHSPLNKHGQDRTPRLDILSQGGAVFVEETAESDTTSYVYYTDDAQLANGRDLFIKNCVQCHGVAGEGGIGPNLTDNYWLHGGQFNNIVKSVKYGYPAKGMISWRAFLKPEQILQVSSFVRTLRGSNPANPKAPQGDLVEEYD